jgi:hypothetical protein
VVAPLPLLQQRELTEPREPTETRELTEQRERRTSVVQPVSERVAEEEVTDTSERTERTRMTAWTSIRDAF